ncbi:MAG: zinc ribbon domain-containing protein [Treponema sp.]|jgi:putative FmdB family regulatory protein|nr:zinc ribbon domain-containing protein [Treponema sp.]
MPTYEYECKSCEHNFETFQSMSDAPLNECPQCGKELRRLINGGTGVIFKGSGFYVTDKNKGTAKTASSKPEEKGKDKDGGKSSNKAAGETKTVCASCPAAIAAGGSCSAPEKAAG